MSIPLDVSGEDSADMNTETLLSPTQASLHPLPPRPLSHLSSTAATSDIMQSYTPVPAHAPPRIRGGFEDDDDDDDDENEEDNEEGKDDLDVYDPEIGIETNAHEPATNAQEALDRTSQSPEQENGLTPLPVRASGSPVDLSSNTFPSGADASHAIVTPAQAPLDAQVQASPPRSNVNGSVVPALPKSRLAHDVVGILEDRIKDDPRGDIPAYLELINEFKSRNKQEEVRQVYEQFLAVFPLAAEQWCAYVRWEEEHDRKFEMERLFNRSLLEVLDVEFWSIYISYIRRRNSMQSGDVARSYKIINESFNFALKTIGMDKDSGRLWQEYIDFIRSGPGVVGGTNWQDGQKVDALREGYQRAIAVPTSVLQSLWKEYEAFETGLSKINGRKYLTEKSPSYMTARSGFTQLKNITDGLDRTSRPRLPPAVGYEGDVEYLQQVSRWKQWIQWEKDDNLVLKEEDLAAYHQRILFTYRQALMALQFWPEMWYDAAEFCFNNGLDTEGAKLLNQGIAANPESPLLAFKLADRIEASSQADESSDPGAKERMGKVREPYDKVLDGLYELAKKVSAREKQDIQKVELAAETNMNGDGIGDDDINAANVTAKKAALNAQIDNVKQGARAQSNLLSKMISHVWIALMRATRRIQGKGLPSERASGFRAIFGEARKRGKLTSDFYVESAQIEWQCYRDPTGTRILDRGMKLFPEDDYLPLQYIKHLFNINDITNARGVFETTVTRMLNHPDPAQKAKAKPLFAFLHEYESKYGELAQVQKLEARMREQFPEDPSLKLFSERFNTPIFDPINVFPIVSPQQMLPKISIMPSVEVTETANSPIQRVIDSIAINSPKRPFPDDFDDLQPRKLARGESPLKGAAGRKINQQSRMATGASAPVGHLPAIPPLPPQISYVLSILPKASLYIDTRFDAAKMVELIREVRLPPPGSLAPHPPQPPQLVQPPGWQQFQQHQHPPPPALPQGYMPPGVSQGQYGNAPFRFA